MFIIKYLNLSLFFYYLSGKKKIRQKNAGLKVAGYDGKKFLPDPYNIDTIRLILLKKKILTKNRIKLEGLKIIHKNNIYMVIPGAVFNLSVFPAPCITILY